MCLYGKYEYFVIQICLSCVHHVVVFNAAFCMTYSLLLVVDDERDDYMEEAYSQACLMTASDSQECLLLFTPSCCGKCSYNV